MEERVELEEEFDDSCELEVVVREFLREVLPRLHGLDGLGRQRLDSPRVELVAPQVLERHGVVVLYVEPWHLLHFGVDARVLPLHVGVVVPVLELAQRLIRLNVVGALESQYPEAD